MPNNKLILKSHLQYINYLARILNQITILVNFENWNLEIL